MQGKWPKAKPTISYLSYKEFDTCERAWFNHYENDNLEGELKWKIKAEKLLAPWNVFAGRIVDDTLSDALLQYKKTGIWPDDLEAMATLIYQEYMRFSKEWTLAVKSNYTWPKSLMQPLDRIYFAENIPRQDLKAVANKVKQCLSNFEKSDMLSWIKSFNRESLECSDRDIEGCSPWFMVGEVPVYAKYDFAIRTADKVYIIDWKTGDPSRYSNSAEAQLQLHGYAAYAISEWGIKPDQVRLLPVWLAIGSKWFDEAVDLDILKELETKWIKRYRLLRERLDMHITDPHTLVGEFPITTDINKCRRCQFRSCLGYQRIKEETGHLLV